MSNETTSEEMVAGCFYELLVLQSNDIIETNQGQSYEDIRIGKGEMWRGGGGGGMGGG